MKDRKSLLGELSSREFLKLALELQYPRGLNLADFSRRAGFSSRSFLSLFLSGKKGLSRDSLERIKSALSLPKEYRLLFSYLAAVDCPSLQKDFKLPRPIATEIISLRQKLQKDYETKSSLAKFPETLKHKELFTLYASLGTESQGAELPEILFKSKLSEKVTFEGLQILTENGLARIENNRYFPVSSKIDFFDLKEPQLISLTKDVSSGIQKDADKILQDSENLMLYFAFSMNPAQRKALKARLKELITSTLDEFQDDAGSRVSHLFICLR